VGKRFILWLLSYAWIVMLAGLGLLAMAVYTTYSAGHGGSIPQESALTSASGHIQGGREMTVERKRRHLGKTVTKYYELDFQPADGAPIKLRIDHDVPRPALEEAIDEDVTVKYDAGGNNDTYVIQQGGKQLVSYVDMARLSQRHADSEKDLFASGGMMGFAALLAILGAGGLVWRRKLLIAENQAIAAAVPSVAIGSDVQPNPGAGAQTPPNAPPPNDADATPRR
jgi:hypothetical protein